MTPRERRASLSLASIYALRMLGLFLILPVFAVHARSLPGGDQPTLVGIALGIYGLTQGVLQIPFGIASDRLGRKPVIIAGLLLFAAGSVVAALATDVLGVVVGRAIQGAGAVSAAVTAFIADETRDSQRTKAMAMVGASIGLTFAVSLVAAPMMYASIGMSGIFMLTAVLALAGVAVVAWVVPPVDAAGQAGAAGAAGPVDGARAVAAPDPAAPAPGGTSARGTLRAVATDPDLLRLNVGIFALHTVQMAMFVVIPSWLVQSAGLPLPEHWKVYLPVVLLSFLFMLPPLGWGERTGRLRTVFVAAIGLLALVELGLALHPAGLVPLTVLLLGFFAGFNVLEATLPSLVSRLAPADARGAALGIYNTTQALGLFAGGGLGGWMAARWSGEIVFAGCAAVLVSWLLIALGQRRWPVRPGAGGRHG
jgi:MFS family permease